MATGKEIQDTRNRQYERAHQLAERLERLYTERGSYQIPVAGMIVNGSTINGIFKVAEAIRKEAQETKQNT